MPVNTRVTENVNSTPLYNHSLLYVLANSPHDFLRPTKSLHDASLALAKQYLDPVAAVVSATQQQRLQEIRQARKRKRDADEIGLPEAGVLRIKSVAVQGFNSQQVWEQTRRIADAVEWEVNRGAVIREAEVDDLGTENEYNEEEIIDGELGDKLSNKESEVNGLAAKVSDEESESEDELEEMANMDSDDAASDKPDRGRKSSVLVNDKFGLNDGFFSIDEFNKYTEMLEQQDARGDPDANAASDEEDIDWDADLNLIQAADRVEKERKPTSESTDEEDDEDEDGPTFGNMSLTAPEGESEGEDHDDAEEDDAFNANDIKYSDFFPPPAQKTSRSKQKRAQSQKAAEINTEHQELVADIHSEDEINRAMASVHRDLFSDESDAEEALPLPANASSHEKNKAAILKQIRELEALNVSKRPWTLSGEARGHDRPVNAILDEDLDFERAGKPLPIITKETSEEIEVLIKRRIIAGEFDEVRRRRPDEMYGKMLSRRGKLDDERPDDKSKKSLAEVYEEEHLRRTDPAFVDDRTAKLTKEHAEIETLWKDVSAKLDSLASWRYRPKPAEMNVTVRTDAPAMRLEDARPSGPAGDVGALGQLAPQEVYATGEMHEKGKIITRGGGVLDEAELTREERKRRRRRAKERAKKAGTGQDGAAKGKTGQKAAIVADLKKGGVKVIGKKGEVRDVDGKEIRAKVGLVGGALKL